MPEKIRAAKLGATRYRPTDPSKEADLECVASRVLAARLSPTCWQSSERLPSLAVSRGWLELYDSCRDRMPCSRLPRRVTGNRRSAGSFLEEMSVCLTTFPFWALPLPSCATALSSSTRRPSLYVH
jgi:hypothetical protein